MHVDSVYVILWTSTAVMDAMRHPWVSCSRDPADHFDLHDWVTSLRGLVDAPLQGGILRYLVLA
jgi:hypothetical protein